MDRITLTTVIIAKNESRRLARCIEALAFSDEIIVIDNGSWDDTAAVAKKAGALVFRSDTKDFSALRTLGYKRARGTWLLYIDADETVTPPLAGEITGLIRSQINSDGHQAYRLTRQNRFFGHPWPHDDHLERLFVKKNLKGWHGPVHESPVVTGSIGDLAGVIVHDTHRTLEEMVNKTNEWSEIEARLRFEAGHPPVVPWRMFRVMITGFYGSYVVQGGWRAGVIGIIEGIYQAYSWFITYAKLWEMQQSGHREDKPDAVI
jgi:glycosyltransferase involved in cell wall biosynthesis